MSNNWTKDALEGLRANLDLKGAELMAFSQGKDPQEWYCLALWLSSEEPYVTWMVNERGETYTGHYHRDYESAVRDFKKRIGK